MNRKATRRTHVPGKIDRALSSGVWVQLAWFTAVTGFIFICLSTIMLLSYSRHETLAVKEACAQTQQWLANNPQVDITPKGLLCLKKNVQELPEELEKLGLELAEDGRQIRLPDAGNPTAQAWLSSLNNLERGSKGELLLLAQSTQNQWEKIRGVLFYFFDSSNIYTEQYQGTWMTIFPIITSLFGMFFFNGLLISTMSNIIERRVSDVNLGMVAYKGLENHIIIIGYGDVSMSLVEDIYLNRKHKDMRECCHFGDFSSQELKKLAPFLPTIVLLTNQEIQRVRSRLFAFIPEELHKHIIFYSGDIESTAHLSRLNVHSAKEVYILGEVEENGRDTKNLEAVRLLSKLRGTGKIARQHQLPIYVQFDRLTSYSIIQKLPLFEEYTRQRNSGVKQTPNIFFRPFNFYENWARLLWGYFGGKNAYEPLDYEPIEGNHFVHLVIVGFNRMGRALLFEALRLCHFPNYVEATHDSEARNKTKITIVDSQMDKLLPAFLAEYPYLHQIGDIDIDYRMNQQGLEHPEIRAMLKEEALNPNCKLTVAICFQDADKSLSMGLSLPEELYYRIVDHKITKADSRILIRQELHEGISRVLENERFKYKGLHVFGMQSNGMNSDLLCDDIPIMVNAYYDIKYKEYESNKDKRVLLDAYDSYIRKHHVEHLTCIDLLNDQRHSDFVQQTAAKLWLHISEDFRFANRYQVDAYGLYQRYAGHPALTQMEHLRWNADRSIIGYKQMPREIIKKNTHYQIHNLIVPFNHLSEQEQMQQELAKDEDVINNMDKLIAFYHGK